MTTRSDNLNRPSTRGVGSMFQAVLRDKPGHVTWACTHKHPTRASAHACASAKWREVHAGAVHIPVTWKGTDRYGNAHGGRGRFTLPGIMLMTARWHRLGWRDLTVTRDDNGIAVARIESNDAGQRVWWAEADSPRVADAECCGDVQKETIGG